MTERVAFGVLVVMTVIGIGLAVYSLQSDPPKRSSPMITRTATPIHVPTISISPTESPTETLAPFIHPKNCATALAYGMTAQQAAAEGLDRDQDGEACYGD